MTTQLAPTDSNLAPGQEGRLTSQNERLLKLLQHSPRTNVELASIAKKYTSRISDLRRHGHIIQCDFIDRETGLTQYTYEGFAGFPQTKDKLGETAKTVTVNHLSPTGRLLQTLTAVHEQKSHTITLTTFSKELNVREGDIVEIIGL